MNNAPEVENNIFNKLVALKIIRKTNESNNNDGKYEFTPDFVKHITATRAKCTAQMIHSLDFAHVLTRDRSAARNMNLPAKPNPEQDMLQTVEANRTQIMLNDYLGINKDTTDSEFLEMCKAVRDVALSNRMKFWGQF
jgi:hypothetical protein